MQMLLEIDPDVKASVIGQARNRQLHKKFKPNFNIHLDNAEKRYIEAKASHRKPL
jgi:hypothetical protein